MKILFTTLFLMAFYAPLTGAQEKPYDCTAQGHHRDFDFWLGQWEVRGKAGKIQGHNSITANQKGCLLEEAWTSATGGTGQSINYYNPVTEQWQQLWVDAGASIIDIRGGLKKGSMELVGSIFYYKEGLKKGFRGRWTLLPDGRVRQFFEEQNEDGEWKVWFDGYYTRVTTE
jgi:hypothetical protein